MCHEITVKSLTDNTEVAVVHMGCCSTGILNWRIKCLLQDIDEMHTTVVANLLQEFVTNTIWYHHEKWYAHEHKNIRDTEQAILQLIDVCELVDNGVVIVDDIETSS